MLGRFLGRSRPSIKVLMVCMGNICRSPMAEAVLRRKLQQAGLADKVSVASAGTHANHVGAAADLRSQARAAARGYNLQGHKARHFKPADFERYDLILAMDAANLERLQEQAPPGDAHKLGLLLDHGSRGGEREVPDPYYSSAEAFDHALDLMEPACDGVVALVRGLASRPPAAKR